MTTVERTRRRFVAVTILYLLLGWSLGLLPWTLLWLAAVIAYNFTGWDRYWWIKNEYPPTGYLVQSVAAWQIGGTLTAHAWTWIILGVCYWQLVFIQDLRDVAGDHAMARATLPVWIGDTAVRILGCLGLTLFTSVTWWITTSQISSIWLILFTICCAVVVVRLATRRGPHADNITYQLYAAFSIVLGVGSLL